MAALRCPRPRGRSRQEVFDGDSSGDSGPATGPGTVRRGGGRAAPGRTGHGRARPQLAVPAGEIDLVLRDGEVLVICEVKTRSSDRVRHAARGGDAPSRSSGCGGWPRTGCRPPVRRPGGPHRHGRDPPAAARRRRRSTTCGGSADARRHRSHHLPPGRPRPPDRRPGRRVPGHGRHDPGRATRHRDQRGPRPVPDGDRQQRLRLAGDPAGHDPAVPGRPAQDAGRTSTSRSRWPSSAPRAASPPRRWAARSSSAS